MKKQRLFAYSEDPDLTPFETKVLLNWHKEFEDQGKKMGKGERAKLRRCQTLEDIGLQSGYHDLRIRLQSAGEVDSERLALVAGLASHVREPHYPLRLGQQMASARTGGNTPVLSELRFRRLLAIDELSRLYVQMIRVIRLLGGEVNLKSLAYIVYWWDSRTKNALATDYFDQFGKTTES